MRTLYIDYETLSIVPGLQAPPVACMSWQIDDGPQDIHHARTGRNRQFPSLRGSHTTIDEILYYALRDDSCIISAYNAAFEAVVTCSHNKELVPLMFAKHEKGLWHCLYNREKQIRIARGNHREVGNLAVTLADYRLGIELDKGSYWRPRYGQLLDTPISEWPQEAVDYSLGDLAVRQLDLAQRQHHPDEYWVDHWLQQQFAFTANLTTCWGFRTDLATATQLCHETAARIEKAKAVILEKGLARRERDGGVFKVKVTVKAAEAYITEAYARLGLPPPRNEPTPKRILSAYLEAGGTIDFDPKDERKLKSAARKMLEELKAHGVELEGGICLDAEACEGAQDPVLEAFTDFKQASTLMKRAETLRIAAEREWPIQPSYNTIVNTGRSSVRQGSLPEPGEPYMALGAQVQNLPRHGEST